MPGLPRRGGDAHTPGMLVVAAAFAVLLYRLAAYERMRGWAWGGASLALSLVVSLIRPGFTLLIVAQVVLVGVLWWRNAKRLGTDADRWRIAREEGRRLERERLDRAREKSRREREQGPR
jgi:hypothetical protein